MDQQVLIAFALTLFAGLSTGIGSAIALLAKRTNFALLAGSLGLSAGVMLYISFMELLGSSIDSLSEIYGKSGEIYAVLAFFGGMVFTLLLDLLVPESENPHEVHALEEMKEGPSLPENAQLMRVGLMSAIIIGLHNFPEGMVTFLTGLRDTSIAIPIAIAIAIHNIPEGITVSVPIFFATGNRKKAFWLSFLSGLSEPVGALIAFLFLAPFLTPALLGILNAIIAGIMVFISLDELLPAADKYGKHHHAIIGMIIGMAAMALTLAIL